MEDQTHQKSPQPTRQSILLQGQKRALELGLSGASLPQVLESIVQTAEEGTGGRLHASLLLLDGKLLRHGAAISLPAAYNEAIDGIAIGPGVGSCGTAAFTGKEVVVSDIANDPLWKDFKELALSHGLRACWSTPVFSMTHELLGTFAFYYSTPSAPTDEDRDAVALLSRTAGLVIEAFRNQQRLSESNERFELVSKATQDPIWDWDICSDTIWGNDRYRIFFGEDSAHAGIRSKYERIHAEDRARVKKSVEEAIASGQEQWSAEYRMQRQDGTWATIFDRAYLQLREGATAVRMLGSLQDITQRKLEEEELRMSEERFQNLVREATVGIIVLMGEACQVTVVNGAYARLIGRSTGELLQKNLFDVIPEAKPVFGPIIEGVRESGQPLYLYDQPYEVFADGQKISGWLNLTYQPYRELSGTITGVMVLCHDVTPQLLSRKQAEEAMATAQLAVESAGLGTFDVDLKTNKMTASPRLDDIFGQPAGVDRSEHILSVHPDDRAARNAAYEAAFMLGELDYEARIVPPNGAMRWVRVKGRVIFNERHEPVKMLGVAQDITEEKEFAAELTRQVQLRTEELEQFTYVSHHDLQEPLRKIAMFSDMIRAETYEQLSESSRSRMDKIIESARRMSRALRDVLEYASLNKRESFVEVDLDDVLAYALSDLELFISDKKARIRSVALPTVTAVQHQMHQLFYNLLNNAIKFSHPERAPEIQISCERLDEQESSKSGLVAGKTWYRIILQDNGIGFDPSASERIFGIFQRIHQSKNYPGTGIGLALCRKVIQNHGGSIHAESVQGEGTRFVILLPGQQ